MQVTGYDYIDKQFYGVLSIRGKIPNAKRKASNVFQNEAIMNIIASLGLEKDVCYGSVKKLRYGRLILMMDQVCVSLSLTYFEFIVAHLVHF